MRVGAGDALIGQDIDGAMAGISGGERRRVSVGISLVTDARVIFLDEPTTGLDSESAESLVGVLARLASARGKMVVCTIHQPSSDVCAMFDDMLLLAKGRLLYCGPWTSADNHFWAAGYKGNFMVTGMLDKIAMSISALSTNAEPERPGASIVRQVAILSARFARSWLRSPASLGMPAAQYLLAALLIGNNALNIAYAQKPLLRREVHAGHYSYLAFYTANCLTSLPLQLAYTAIYTITVYFLVGYQRTCAKFSVFSAIALLLGLISETLGILCSGLFRSQLLGAIVLQGLYVPLLMFVGFFQTHTPAYLEWLRELSFASYGYSALVKNEFMGLQLRSGDAVVVTNAETSIPSNIESEHSIASSIGVLLCILVGLRIVVYVQMCISIRRKFL
ncbi:hypothetical protein COCSUDRAFT_57645 [Coccomyxa subellipsoidea C-169]|uniref:ABC-2 type transporter transmembrane domain-containing protein n=1 Tax=Coccomyxa subellipsoidea (strain C-169) TaxID=574566 RepID=I0YQ29_COCSC|nr:hypothetical protein COCSUDRAFT_57645 [Coccomyxa subellipsoidea C-169]EIE20498.1 hypothetical protein COCSUDRAFT_57645 [Coccomyxa subellipsoidea C-169]|eukprot:XP_005645042.1 hypothetical protein COCSUDRAFT_57645 [Coccomyxa subellipsoidea C-169]